MVCGLGHLSLRYILLTVISGLRRVQGHAFHFIVHILGQEGKSYEMPISDISTFVLSEAARPNISDGRTNAV